MFCTGYVVLYAQTRDPFFLATLGIVGAGLVASSLGLALDRRSMPARAYAPPERQPVTMIEANGLARLASTEVDDPPAR